MVAPLFTAQPHVIDDGNYREVCGVLAPDNPLSGGHERRSGIKPRDFGKHSYGSLSFAKIYEDSGIKPVPKSDWSTIARRQIASGRTLKHLSDAANLPCLDQDGLSYCHTYSLAGAVHLRRRQQGLPHVDLSPESVGGPVTGFRNEGAWCGDDLAQAMKVGYCVASMVPQYDYRGRKWEKGWEENADRYKIVEAVDLSSNDIWANTVSCLLSLIPVFVGLDWWGHAVYYVGLTENLDIIFRNSWGTSYGENGYGILAGHKKVPSEAYAITQIRATNMLAA